MCVNNFNFGIVSWGFPFHLGSSCKDSSCVNRGCRRGTGFVQRVVSGPGKEIKETMMSNPCRGIEERSSSESGSGYEESMESDSDRGREERIASRRDTGIKRRVVSGFGKGIERRIVSNGVKEKAERIVSKGIEKKVAFLMRRGIGEPAGFMDIFLIAISILLVICTFPLSLFFCFKVVQEYERAVIFRLGRLSKGGARGPGLFFILPCTDNYCKVDLRTVSFNVPPQEVLSKDSVTVAVDAVVYYRISNATIAVSNVADYATSTQLLAATTLRTVLGTKSLSEILSEREHISHVMQSSLDEATTPWGVKVERVEIKDVRLPQQMQRAMAAEAEASREARAKVIAAEGEQKASRALKEAADVIADSPGALQLRYLQTLTSIAAEKNSTVVFPLPMELMRGMGLK